MSAPRGLNTLHTALVAAIVLIDWLTPPSVVVGILLCLPIMLASLTEKPRSIWLTFAFATAGFLAAAVLGRAPISPAQIWLPNRVFVFLTLPATCAIALRIQTHRRQILQAREDEARSSDLNRLLNSLLAHDLRSPLNMAVEAIDYAHHLLPSAGPDPDLLSQVRARLHRSVAMLDGILSLDRPEASAADRGSTPRTGKELASELSDELRAFATEAQMRSKELAIEIVGDERAYTTDLLVARQAAAILVDNAIRHAQPGTVRITGQLTKGTVRLAVSDPGPAEPSSETRRGSGIGLELCRALVLRAGGTLTRREIESPGGTVLSLTLPIGGAPAR